MESIHIHVNKDLSCQISCTGSPKARCSRMVTAEGEAVTSLLELQLTCSLTGWPLSQGCVQGTHRGCEFSGSHCSGEAAPNCPGPGWLCPDTYKRQGSFTQREARRALAAAQPVTGQREAMIPPRAQGHKTGLVPKLALKSRL